MATILKQDSWMSTTRIVGILPSNCNDKNGKIGFQAVTCDFGTSEILCHYLYVTLCAGSCTSGDYTSDQTICAVKTDF